MTSISRPLRPGDVVLEAEPFAHMLKVGFWGELCHFCLKQNDSLKRCGRCLTFSYCSKDCQVKDWNTYHKLGECRAYKRAKELGLTGDDSLLGPKHMLSLYLRVYLLCKKTPEVMDKEYTLPDGSTCTYRDLKTHEEEFMAADFGMKFYQVNWLIRTFIEPVVPDLDIDLFFECWLKKNVASSAIQDITGQMVASAVYIGAPALGHSCRPNAGCSFIGTKMIIRAIRDIPEGEPITVSYVALPLPREQRQRDLEVHFLECNCERCLAGDGPDFVEKFKEMEQLCEQELDDDGTKSDAELMRQEFEGQKKFLALFEHLVDLPYFPCLTYHMVDVVKASLTIERSEADMQFLTSHMSKTREHVLVTHGAEHPIFDRLTRYISLIERGVVIRL